MQTRRLMTKGLYNARDLGGFPTRDGCATKFGVFVRSEAPVELPQGDLDYLKAYGVTASIDFRGDKEAEARPSDLKVLLPYYHCPVFDEAAMAGSGTTRPPRGEISWGEHYISMAEGARAWAREVLTIAAENPGVLLYHCTTGKDRTGLMTCYLLSIAGVERADIAADYCVSQVFLEPLYGRMRSGSVKLGPPPEGTEGRQPPMGLPQSFFETPASAMLTLLDHFQKEYGGVVEYLRSIQVPEQVLVTIRSKLVD